MRDIHCWICCGGRNFSRCSGWCERQLRETACWVALEVAAADRLVRPEELRFLEMLGDALELNRTTTAAFERGIRARNTTL